MAWLPRLSKARLGNSRNQAGTSRVTCAVVQIRPKLWLNTIQQAGVRSYGDGAGWNTGLSGPDHMLPSVTVMSKQKCCPSQGTTSLGSRMPTALKRLVSRHGQCNLCPAWQRICCQSRGLSAEASAPEGPQHKLIDFYTPVWHHAHCTASHTPMHACWSIYKGCIIRHAAICTGSLTPG